jgi:hypothetical protein
MVAKYLREQGFPLADRRLREGRADDQGDIDGVPGVVIQVKNVESNRYAAWVLDTIKQRNMAGAVHCLLVRRVPRKPVEQWEASMPDPRPELPESEAWTWHRMDLRLAVHHLHEWVEAMTYRSYLSGPSLSTTTFSSPGETRTWPSALSTESGSRPSATT